MLLIVQLEDVALTSPLDIENVTRPVKTRAFYRSMDPIFRAGDAAVEEYLNRIVGQ
jgi:hypothetical protein